MTRRPTFNESRRYAWPKKTHLIRPEESSVVDSLITAAGEAVNLGWVLIADGSLTVEAIDRLVATLRVRSHHLMGVECRPFGELEPAVNSASVAIAHLCDLGLHR